MTAKVAFPPKTAVWRNTLICMGITAQEQQGAHETLHRFFCSVTRMTLSWSFLSDVCLSSSQESPLPEPQKFLQVDSSAILYLTSENFCLYLI